MVPNMPSNPFSMELLSMPELLHGHIVEPETNPFASPFDLDSDSNSEYETDSECSDSDSSTEASSTSGESTASVYLPFPGHLQDLEPDSEFSLSEADRKFLAESYALLDTRSAPSDDTFGAETQCTLGMVRFPIRTVTGNVVIVSIDHSELFDDDLDDLFEGNRRDADASEVPRELQMVFAPSILDEVSLR
ncbi:hypothetical protein B0T16DRAFT_461108 [Cercophora newfieldiana]|uniref:Uncharacterized protein n=1 Tax=Cercophora newfieldiana TaxID=92897 RepID=A0AA39XVQ3_9PEZI|nr:hypothetical protein B0T16DRAFT_461108 [Cercophora newfieldiana]